MSRKHKAKAPSRLRMDRAQRLPSARVWLKDQAGRKPAQIGASYRRWYGVDWFCAIEELSRLGVNFEPRWMEHLKSSLQGQRRARAARRADKTGPEALTGCDESDEDFAFIAGYTAGGYAYGVACEDWEILERKKRAGREPDPF